MRSGSEDWLLPPRSRRGRRRVRAQRGRNSSIACRSPAALRWINFTGPRSALSRDRRTTSTVVVDELAAHLSSWPAKVDGLVFTTALGESVRRTSFSAQVWRPTVKAAGLPVRTRFHDMRHHYASLLIRHGESVKTVQARLGHATAAETLDVYSHLWPDSDDRTREAVDAALGNLADSVRTEGMIN